MSITVARKIAYDILRRVESENAYASDLLHAELGAQVKPADAALATEITLGVLRWRRLLDFLLDRHLKKPVERLDLPVALALRIGAYQLHFLDKIPARAAVNESVELVKLARKSSAAALVNAVLRKAAAEVRTPPEEVLAEHASDLAAAERLAILHSHPTWFVERWLPRYGEQGTIALLQANNTPPPLSCAIHHPSERSSIVAELEKSGLHVAPGQLLNSAISITGGSIVRTEPFRAGQISIQDEASQAVPLLLDTQPGDRVLDLCAAPGGKTPPLIRAIGPRGLLVAADIHLHRLKSTRSQLARLGFDHPRLIALDAAQPLPFSKPFDRVLLDAPCSGTGTLARHPEIRWRLRPEQLAEFHALQVQLLRNALAHLAPGGRLVYSTCSLEPKENEAVIAEVLAAPVAISTSVRRAPLAKLAVTLEARLAPGISASSLFDSDGQFHASPALQHTDGFFAAALVKS
jgi:16S rRNA (cytosine967-C5)-methyltransferase